MKKFNKDNKKKKIIISILIIILVGLVLVQSSYAFFQRQTEVRFINARVGKFVANDIELAMKVDGKEVSAPPAKNSLYQVEVNCDNATGTWDKDKWGAIVTNISTGKVKCEVNFVTPSATLTNITATSGKTTINLSYTASGIGTTTTCVYGKTNSYGSTASGTTNTKCSMSGLSMDTTYYYKVCAKNATGEVCREGSAKTVLFAEQVKEGDYISMTPTSTSYTISKDLTGVTSDQTINPSELDLWRVIKVNSDGTVEMVSEYVSSKKVYFKGETGYINFISVLNSIASQYTDGKNVLRTRHIGYSNQTEKITDTNKLKQKKAPWTKNTSKYNQWTGCNTSNYLCGTDENLGAGDIGYETDYSLVNTVYGNMKAYNPSGTETHYFFASRYFNYDSDTRWDFSVRYVGNLGIWSRVNILYNDMSSFYSSTISNSIRPIVTLKSTSEKLSGSGTSSSPYILN